MRQLLSKGWKAEMDCTVDAPLGAGSYLAWWVHLNTGWFNPSMQVDLYKFVASVVCMVRLKTAGAM